MMTNNFNIKNQNIVTSISDLRIIDMYEDAILSKSDEPLRDREGNWVQKYAADEDALLFASAQFSRFQEIESFVRENLTDPAKVMFKVGSKGRRL